jgi:hypothetical protein
VVPGGRLCLLVGTGQMKRAQEIMGDAWSWKKPVAVPRSKERVVVIAERG